VKSSIIPHRGPPRQERADPAVEPHEQAGSEEKQAPAEGEQDRGEPEHERIAEAGFPGVRHHRSVSVIAPVPGIQGTSAPDPGLEHDQRERRSHRQQVTQLARARGLHDCQQHQRDHAGRDVDDADHDRGPAEDHVPVCGQADDPDRDQRRGEDLGVVIAHPVGVERCDQQYQHGQPEEAGVDASAQQSVSDQDAGRGDEDIEPSGPERPGLGQVAEQQHWRGRQRHDQRVRVVAEAAAVQQLPNVGQPLDVVAVQLMRQQEEESGQGSDDHRGLDYAAIPAGPVTAGSGGRGRLAHIDHPDMLAQPEGPPAYPPAEPGF
jgi:hypothetical protein